PDAGKPEIAAKKRTGGGGGGCSGACKGNATPALQAALGGAAGSARGCYERALRTNSMLQGKLVVGVRVAPGGGTCNASIVTDTLGDGAVGSCVLQKFRGGTFPAPAGGCVDVQVPISFMPKTAK
ncbi:MAG: AgmX/PglI C-terminal domain-containing protein, partial [Deltaproteobacteria bacterium]|nr:AgmX/PglI C-terminal domain-containing protein [Deltaproteobacteria bacterium]